MKNLKFATKLLLVILSISIVSMIAVSTISYTELLNLSGYSQDANVQLGFYASDNSKQALIDQAESYMIRLALSQAAECNETLLMIQRNVETMSGFMHSVYSNPGDFTGRPLPLPDEVRGDIATAKLMVAKDVEITPQIEREILLIGNAEHVFGPIQMTNPYMSNAYLGSVTGINFRWSVSNAHNPDFDPRVRPWFLAAIDSNTPVWLDTYLDAFGFLLTTCAFVYKDGAGNPAGVVATDIHLSTMIENILNFRIGETGYAFLIDSNGRYLAHPAFDASNQDGFSSAGGEYGEVLASMAAGESAVRRVTVNSVEHYIAYAPLSVTGWSLGIAVEYDEIIADALMMKADIDNQAIEVREQIRAMLNSVMFRFIMLTCIIIIAVLILSIMISGSVTKPIIKLTNGVIEVGKGNLESKIDIKTNDEIGVLASHFNKMTDDLVLYITNLEKVTAEKERIGAELDVATKIQASMLPCIFPPFPERSEFDLYASMIPAKEVGGDFYDFFMTDDNTLAVVMADVSGKGVPAALFMVIAKTLIKNNAQNGKSPGEVFTAVNNLLCENNDAGMFVTAFMGYLDIPSGRFTYVNAGHNFPLIKKAGGTYEFLHNKPAFILAGFEDVKYTEYEITLESGDVLYLYTDGVTEAMNPENELFSDPHLIETANKYVNISVKELVAKIKEEVDIFADGAEQADDITMLALEITGEEQ
ncbi:MAG: SpoIIE family protein phosphatase [Oscillospiraceae bacterium]|nr:SpoIIE family protein phosphatase [Oscillospiraceae bacterium]